MAPGWRAAQTPARSVSSRLEILTLPTPLKVVPGRPGKPYLIDGPARLLSKLSTATISRKRRRRAPKAQRRYNVSVGTSMARSSPRRRNSQGRSPLAQLGRVDRRTSIVGFGFEFQTPRPGARDAVSLRWCSSFRCTNAFRRRLLIHVCMTTRALAQSAKARVVLAGGYSSKPTALIIFLRAFK